MVRSDRMIHVHADAGAVARASAEHVTRFAHAAIAARGVFRIALSGGTSPERLYRLLATPAWRERIHWPAITVLLADERAVQADDPQRNLRLVREALLDPLGASAPEVRPMRGDA